MAQVTNGALHGLLDSLDSESFFCSQVSLRLATKSAAARVAIAPATRGPRS